MNLYYLSSDGPGGYDTYSSAVVAAEDSEDAKSIHPDGYPRAWTNGTWARTPSGVTAELIGTAVDGTERGVICASFHAG